MQRLSFEGENKKVESCFAPSGHKGVERFEARLTRLAYFGERFREGNIRYNETFTDRPSFQPPLSFASIEHVLTATFLHSPAQTTPEQHCKIREGKHLTPSLVFFVFVVHVKGCLSKCFLKSFVNKRKPVKKKKINKKCGSSFLERWWH